MPASSASFDGVADMREWTAEEIRRAMRLYAVTDDAWLEGRTLDACVAEALAGGATFVQLRRKGVPAEALAEEARKLIPPCRQAEVPFVINDSVEAALLSGADGVHVGQSDAACAYARQVLGPRAIVGVSVQTVVQALDAQEAGASYLGVGAVVPTSTKLDAEIVPASELAAICAAVDIPVVAIGGINQATIPALCGSGIDGVAVVSAIFSAPDIRRATMRLSALVDDVVYDG